MAKEEKLKKINEIRNDVFRIERQLRELMGAEEMDDEAWMAFYLAYSKAANMFTYIEILEKYV